KIKMNLKRLPKEKRNQLISVVVVIVLCLAAWGFGLIRYQYGSLRQLSESKDAAEKKLQLMHDTVKLSGRFKTDLADAQRILSEAETDVASGDLYSWLITNMRRFRASYKVEMPSISPISPTTDVNLLANFPYKQTS